MSAYYATHAGLLRYVADDFSAMAVADAERGRELELYAEILRRMIDDLAGRASSGRVSGGRDHLASEGASKTP